MKSLVAFLFAAAACLVLSLLLVNEAAHRRAAEAQLQIAAVRADKAERALRAEREPAATRDTAMAAGRAARAERRRSPISADAETPSPPARPAADLTPVAQLHDAGRGSAHDAFATQVWASSVGNIDAAAAAITFTSDGRAMLEKALKELPASVTSQYDTPEKLMAYVLAGSPHPMGGIRLGDETVNDDHSVTLNVAWQHADDDIVHHNALLFTQDASGQWRQQVPDALVRRAVAYLTRRN